MYSIRILPRTLHFKQPAGTSRGVYLQRRVWFLLLEDRDSGQFGVGECAPLPRLSCDDLPNYEDILARACRQAAADGQIDVDSLQSFPSILFGLETAFRHLRRGSLRFWDTPFSRGAAGIPINGLIWMGDFDTMLRRVQDKLQAGYTCIKIKIGAIDFDQELNLLAHIRNRFSREQIELRVDANGAFSPAEALRKLERLNAFDLHSIEQPIRAGQWDAMAELCRQTPVPIALDEELIGINTPQQQAELLDAIRPQYIILKPSLHGGWHGAESWIQLARQRGIGSWITSALESNVGLNSLAQWCATQQSTMPQGLGTGQLFLDNVPSPLTIRGNHLWFQAEVPEPDWRSILLQSPSTP